MDASYIIPRSQHNVSKTNINVNALKVLNRINSSGFKAYLVGGSVRDLLLGKRPKDFDVATNATPNQIKKLFRNARIIGRRFKLVHILYGREVIEVATFRGNDEIESANQITNESGMLVRDNVYGTLEDDVWRRDFTINSLYYNLEDSSIIDFTGGVNDVRQGVVRLLGNALTRYQEDPVRMLRAVRFSAKLHFTLAPETAAPIKTLSPLLENISSSRLFDEITKLSQCGEVERAFHLMMEHGLFACLFKQTDRLLNSDYPVKALLGMALESTDTRIRNNKPITPAFIFAVLLWFPLKVRAIELQNTENSPPLAALERAMTDVIVLQNQVVTVPKRFTQMMREIWLLQFRFQKRTGNRAYNLLAHPRFRAAYDFLILRSLVNDETKALAEWWTIFQDVPEEKQKNMIDKLSNVKSDSQKQ
ncbi:MAG: poly(A) polymerase [Legionellales bacterium RIFCSPHIGHO2_12_FULL_42_9]|nr:MAG: poly(A) polymerase [Legionellales bacterium RIFCSPHIGHO2_12_FULL_42_9]